MQIACSEASALRWPNSFQIETLDIKTLIHPAQFPVNPKQFDSRNLESFQSAWYPIDVLHAVVYSKSNSFWLLQFPKTFQGKLKTFKSLHTDLFFHQIGTSRIFFVAQLGPPTAMVEEGIRSRCQDLGINHHFESACYVSNLQPNSPWDTQTATPRRDENNSCVQTVQFLANAG